MHEADSITPCDKRYRGYSIMDEKLLYMAGNGKMCAAYRYGTLRVAFGPPYSAPSAFASDFSDTYDKLPPTKEPLCAIWYTPLKKDGVLNATLTDFVPPHLPALVRLVESTVPVTVNLFPYKEGLLEYVYQIAPPILRGVCKG